MLGSSPAQVLTHCARRSERPAALRRCPRSLRTTYAIVESRCCISEACRGARIGELVGQRDLAVTANTYTHVLVDEIELDYAELLR
jgi:integrase